jgi:hypothetical protein
MEIPQTQMKWLVFCKEWGSNVEAATNDIQRRNLERKHYSAANEMVAAGGDRVDQWVGRITKIEEHYVRDWEPFEWLLRKPWDVVIEHKFLNLGDVKCYAMVFELDPVFFQNSPVFFQLANIPVGQLVVYSGRFLRNKDGNLEASNLAFSIELGGIQARVTK